jgi:hypothetical protein
MTASWVPPAKAGGPQRDRSAASADAISTAMPLSDSMSQKCSVDPEPCDGQLIRLFLLSAMRGVQSEAWFCLRAGRMALRVVIAIAMSCVWGMQAGAQQTDVPGKLLEPIVVTAKKQEVPKTDEEVTKQVEAALRADRYVFDDHVRITTKDGVVTLSGFVLDVWDVYSLKRIVRKMAGVKRVVDQLTIELGGD